MTKRLFVFSLICILFILSSCEDAENQIYTFVEPEGYTQAHWGARVEDLETGEVLVDHFGNKQFIPASVVKLFSTQSALQILGADYQFSTKVYSFTPIDEDGVLRGNLVLEGGSDPLFDHRSVQHLVMQLIEQGLNTIEGSVVVDLGNQKGPPLMTHAEWEDLTWGYCAEVSPLTYQSNFVLLNVAPSREAGFPALIEIEQDVPYVSFLSGVGTGTQEEKFQITCDRGITDNTVEVRGVIPEGHPPVQMEIAVFEAAEYARQVFEKELLARGVKIKRQAFRNNQGRSDLAVNFSPPLIEIVKQVNKSSDNLSAELVFLEIPETARPELADGSGLSRHHLVTPEDVCHLIRQGNEQWMETFPIAGVDGTLKQRFKETFAEGNVRAKTGSMSGVLGMAGVAKTQTGREVCFCLFLNQFTQELGETLPVFDQVVLSILSSQ